MEEVILTLQKYQNVALDNGMSFNLDVIKNPEETKASATIRTASSGLVDDQRYMKVWFTSDEEPEFTTSKLECVKDFIYQVSTSLNYKKED